jgi:hypothetical protein
LVKGRPRSSPYSNAEELLVADDAVVDDFRESVCGGEWVSLFKNVPNANDEFGNNNVRGRVYEEDLHRKAPSPVEPRPQIPEKNPLRLHP